MSNDYWQEWMNDIPFLSFPSDWKVQVLPSFGGAACRFFVINQKGGEASVFLDLHGNLTIDAPCWEVNDADMRFAPDDIEGLMVGIGSIKPKNKARSKGAK